MIISIIIGLILLSSSPLTYELLNTDGDGFEKIPGRPMPIVYERATDTIPLPDTSFPSAERIKYEIEYLDESRSGRINVGKDPYAGSGCILTFRGNHQRDANSAFPGRIEGRPSTIDIEWTFNTRYDATNTSVGGVWGGGTGWTGQPLYIDWNQVDTCSGKSTCSKEIILGSLCGDLYFINFETGKESRKTYKTGNPIKGTVMADPSMNGNIYIGHGIPARQPFGAKVYNMFAEKEINSKGRDPKAWRAWGAYDSSPIKVGDYVIRPSENGTIYKILTDSTDVRIHSLMRYKVNGIAPGMEASMAVFRNYGYITDNRGNLICINLNNLEPVWHHAIGDDTDATPVIEVENGVPMLYVGCELDKQGGSGKCWFTKVNGLNGEVIWKNSISCSKFHYGESEKEGGMFATPLLGGGNCSDMIFTNICGADRHKGIFIAMDKKTGKEIYRIPLKYYSWSSPVSMYNENDEMFIFTADVIGNTYLIDPAEGKIITVKKVGRNFEASPIIIEDKVIIGSRGREIYKLNIN